MNPQVQLNTKIPSHQMQALQLAKAQTGKSISQLVQAALMMLCDELGVDTASFDTAAEQTSATMYGGFSRSFLQGLIDRRQHPYFFEKRDTKLEYVFDKYAQETDQLAVIDAIHKEEYEKEVRYHRGRKDAYGEHKGVDSWGSK